VGTSGWFHRSHGGRKGTGAVPPDGDRRRPGGMEPPGAPAGPAAVTHRSQGRSAVTAECERAARPAEEELLSLPASQVVLATVEGRALVVDCLVAPVGGATTPRVPFALRARLPSGRHGRLPRRLRRWVDRGRLVDISLRDRCGAMVARISPRGSKAVVELQLCRAGG
jgi:hypothetical protein